LSKAVRSQTRGRSLLPSSLHWTWARAIRASLTPVPHSADYFPVSYLAQIRKPLSVILGCPDRTHRAPRGRTAHENTATVDT